MSNNIGGYLYLNEICDIVSSKVSVENLSEENYISTDNMLSDLNGISGISNLPTKGKVNSYQKGDILFSNIRTYFRKVWLAPQNGGCSNDIIVFRPKEDYTSEYVFFVLSDQNFIDYTVKTSKGTKMPRGDKQAILKYSIPKFSILDSKKIGDTLIGFHNKIELNRQTNKTLEEMAQALFQSWFVDFDPVIDNALKAGNSIPEALQQKAEKRKSLLGNNPHALPETIQSLFPSAFVWNEVLGKWVPEGWGVNDLDNFCICFDSKRKPISSNERAKIKGQFPYYGAMSIVDYINGYLFDGIYLLVSEDGANVVDEKGRPATQYVYGKFWLNNHAHIIQGKGVFTTEYLKNALSFVNANHLVTGAAQPKINQKNLMSIKIINPNEKNVDKYCSIIKQNYEKIINNNNQIKALIEQRDILLPKLISGQLELD